MTEDRRDIGADTMDPLHSGEKFSPRQVSPHLQRDVRAETSVSNNKRVDLWFHWFEY